MRHSEECAIYIDRRDGGICFDGHRRYYHYVIDLAIPDINDSIRPLLLTLHQLKIVADDAQDLALMSLSLQLPPESAFGLASIQVYRYSHT